MKCRVLALILALFMLATSLTAFGAASEMMAILSLERASGFAEEAVKMHLSVSGGRDGVKVTYYCAYNDGESIALNNAARPVSGGRDTFEFTPRQEGTYIITAVAEDGSKRATTVVTLRVAEHDTESLKLWSARAKSAVTEGDWRGNLVTVAYSQLDYEESITDFVRFEDGSQMNYSIYGDWAGSAYEEWCAAFVSFCLDNALAPADLKADTAAEMMEKAMDAGMYADAEEHEPKPGDIAFIENNRMGIVVAATAKGITVIEGNVDMKGIVGEKEYPISAVIAYAAER